jgi:hypothetical protein
VTTYWYTFGLLAIAAALMTVAIALKLPKGQVWFTWFVGAIALGFCLAAGVHATHTFVDGVVGWIVNWSPWVRLALGIVVLMGVAYVIAALIPDAFHGVATTMALLALVFLLPSAQWSHQLVPGKVGATVGNTAHALAEPMLTLTAGWFG